MKKAIEDNPTLVMAYAATFDPSKGFWVNVQAFDYRLFSQSRGRTIATAEQLISVAGDSWFEAYHITRLIDPNEIRNQGIDILDWENYHSRIESVLSSYTDLKDPEIKRVLDRILEFYKEDGVGRLGHLSFFSPASDYVLYYHNGNSGGYYHLYGLTIGGELLEHSLRGNLEYESLFKLLSNMGTKYLVRFKFQLKDLFRNLCDYSYDLFMHTIAFAVLYCREHSSLPCDCLFVSHLQRPVLPENILSIDPFPAEIDDSY